MNTKEETSFTYQKETNTNSTRETESEYRQNDTTPLHIERNKNNTILTNLETKVHKVIETF